MHRSPRSEALIFADLAELTRSAGYAHAAAQICHRDNLVMYEGEMKPADMGKLFGRERLIRTEITTLLGLMVKGALDLTEPSHEELLLLVKRTDALMSELQAAMNAPMVESMRALLREGKSEGKPEDMWTGATLREPIFYGGESAYSFQYRELVTEKYGADDEWLVTKRGFTIVQAQAVARALCDLMDAKSTKLYAEAQRSGSPPSSWLQCFEHTPAEIAFRSRVPAREVQAVLDAFTLKENNEAFLAVGDFNAVAACPLIPTGRGTVLMYQHYGILEALYESPFYWMIRDKCYRDTASAHRGEFTEKFTERRLLGVFGRKHVYRGVNLVQSKVGPKGEIDVLVVFGDRIVIVQAKSKKLTIEARKGNDGQLRKDFAGAIQDSYDQAWSCATAIVEGDCQLVGSDGSAITLPHPPKEIYIFCVVSDNYPALAFQARQFLRFATTEVIKPPFVMDVFLLDALTEMLSTPLRLLSYVAMRVKVIEKVVISHEFTALGFHLKRNLWLESDASMYMLDDTIAVDLDTAMTVRREYIAGQHTPPGILTRLAGSLYERLIQQIEDVADPPAIAMGFELLSMSEQACWNVHNGIDLITRQTRADGQLHDFSLGHGEGGLCLHCNAVVTEDAKAALGRHCEKRKYRMRASQWFGLSVDPQVNIQFGVTLNFPWVQSDALDRATRDMQQGAPAGSIFPSTRPGRRAKTGRNELCPCGSGKKYKKCHLLLKD
jgi:hypothetical protein